MRLRVSICTEEWNYEVAQNEISIVVFQRVAATVKGHNAKMWEWHRVRDTEHRNIFTANTNISHHITQYQLLELYCGIRKR